MLRLIVPLLAVALFVPLLAVAQDGEVVRVRLRDGQKVVGKISENECTTEELVIRLIRGNAKRQIPWSDVNEEDARQLRIKLGFEVAEESEGLRIKAVEITNRAGSTFTGLLVNKKTVERDGEYVLKTSDGPRHIRVDDVRSGPDEVEVDALAVYTALELYEQRRKAKPPETAEDHFLLAQFARTIGADEQAREHYQAVLGMEQDKYPVEMIQRLLARVEKRLANKEALDLLADVKKAIVYNKFDQAQERLGAFKERYAADEDLMSEAADLEKELGEKRTEYYVDRIPAQVRDNVKKFLLKKLQTEKELTLRKAQEFAGGEAAAEESVTHEAVLATAEKFGIEPEEVLDFYSKRTSRVKQRAFYRDGTFIVIDNLADALAKAPKIKPRKGDNAPKPPKPTPRKTPDKWWEEKLSSRKHSDLRDWLYAYWAEKCGLNEVFDPKWEICPSCAGKGYTQTLTTTPQGTVPFFNRCQTCYEATQFKIVIFR